MTRSNGTLPEGWRYASLGDICHIEMGQSPPSSSYNTTGNGLPFFQGKAEFTETYPVVRKWCSTPLKIASKGDVLISVRAPVGPTNLAPSQCCIGRGLAALSPNQSVDSRYLLHYLRSLEGKIAHLGTGTTFGAIQGRVLRNLQVAVAPCTEQRRIVEVIEALLSSLNSGVSTLGLVKANLSRYRSSILKAAISGRLTEQWRDENPNGEPASKLLERILDERRRKWEENQIREYAKKGKGPPKGWKEKYEEPFQPNVQNLPTLPEGWCWCTLDAISTVVGGVTKGQKRSKDVSVRNVPYLRVANVQRGFLDLSEIATIPAMEDEITELRLRPGDILFNEGGDRDKLGRGWVWNGEIDECIHQNHVFRARLILGDLEPRFFSHHGNVFGQNWFMRTGKQSVNLASINKTVLRQFPVPLAPIPEQKEIVARVSILLDAAAQMETQVLSGVRRGLQLRQAILETAFKGRLVPQDPADEPADVLLSSECNSRDTQHPLCGENRQ